MAVSSDMRKTRPAISPSILKSFRKIAAVLGVSPRELAEEELERRATEVDEMAFGELVEQFFADLLFDSRKSAEEMAERLEAFAVDANLEEGRENSGAIATSVVQSGRRRLDGQNRLSAPCQWQVGVYITSSGQGQRRRGVEGVAALL
jgi:hypothetical protein